MLNVGDEIWFMKDNKVHSAKVFSRMIVDNGFENYAHTDKQKEIYMQFGPQGVYYMTVHGIIDDRIASGSKQELLNIL